MAPFSEEEVTAAMFQMEHNKAPGPDGMPAIFFKRFWKTVGNQITKEVLHILRGGDMPEGWNDTLIVLIPKNTKPMSLKDLRPISLCNVVYKVISKMLAARLKVLLPDIISETQSAFVPGRIINDNVIVAYECLHTMKKRKKGKVGTCAIKLDMHKAYDRVEWNFL